MSNHTVKIQLELEPFAAYALAELCKRIGFQDCMSNATNQDEAYHMMFAMGLVRKALEQSGVAVR